MSTQTPGFEIIHQGNSSQLNQALTNRMLKVFLPSVLTLAQTARLAVKVVYEQGQGIRFDLISLNEEFKTGKQVLKCEHEIRILETVFDMYYTAIEKLGEKSSKNPDCPLVKSQIERLSTVMKYKMEEIKNQQMPDNN